LGADESSESPKIETRTFDREGFLRKKDKKQGKPVKRLIPGKKNILWGIGRLVYRKKRQ